MKFKLRYLKDFEDDLFEAASYISERLSNPQAAERFLKEVSAAILKRQEMPLGFEPYRSVKKRDHDYYRIYVGNYTVFYVVIEDVMEVRRLIYSARDLNRIL